MLAMTFRALPGSWYGPSVAGRSCPPPAGALSSPMNRLSPQGPSLRPRLVMRAALVVACVAAAMGSVAAMTLRAAPATDVIDGKRGQIRVLEAEIQRIDTDATAAADAHAAALGRADRLRARIADTTRGLTEARAARSVALARLSERIVGLYRREPPSLVEIVLSSGGLAAAADTQSALEAVGAQDRHIVDQIAATRKRLSRLKTALLDDRAAVEASVADSGRRLTELRSLLTSRRGVLDEAQVALGGLVAQGRRDRAAAARATAAAAVVERDLLRRADPAPAAAEPPAQESTPAPPGPSGDVSSALQRIAQCESGGNPRAVSTSGQYRGKYQFDVPTWESLGGSGDPAAAPEAEQDRIAALLYASRGPAPWPVCGYR